MKLEDLSEKDQIKLLKRVVESLHDRVREIQVDYGVVVLNETDYLHNRLVLGLIYNSYTGIPEHDMKSISWCVKVLDS